MIARQTVRQNVNQLREERSQFAPSLMSNVSYTNNDSNAALTNPLDTGESDEVVYSLNLNMPISSGGKNYYSTKQRSLELSQAEIDYRNQITTTEHQFDATIRTINDHVDSLDSLAIIIDANFSSSKGIKRAYKLGTRTITDVLASESKLYNSVRDYENLRYDFVIELISLNELMGDLNQESIQKIAQWMGPLNLEESTSPIPLHLIKK